MNEERPTRDAIQIAMICDRYVVEAACVTLFSIRRAKALESRLVINIIDIDLHHTDRNSLLELSSPNFQILFKEPKIHHGLMHKSSRKSIASANSSSLQKFFIPELFPELGTVLYLDCDLIVKSDLTNLYNLDLDGNLAAVVADSGQLYYRTPLIGKVERYFNSGVMLLNLVELRRQNSTEDLLNYKQTKCDGNLVDQDAFNYVFDGKVKYLSVRYNCLCVNIERSKERIDVGLFNRLYNEDFSDLDQAIESAYILHFASKDKPWKFSDVRCADQWFDLFSEAKLAKPEVVGVPKVSVIIPIFNLEKYLNPCLDSFIRDSIADMEVVLVDDGSSDRSGAIVDAWSKRDKRVKPIHQSNAGQSTARNNGLKVARGEYVYFLDGDDLLKPAAISEFYHFSKKNKLDVLYFDAESFFESEELQSDYFHYTSYYKRDMTATGVMTGAEMLLLQSRTRSIKPSVCLQFYRRRFLTDNEIKFHEGVIYEDNAFSLHVALAAQRSMYNGESWYLRRVRYGSTITSKRDHRNYQSYIRVAAEIFRVTQRSAVLGEVREVAYGLINGMLRSASEVYSSLQSQDRRRAFASAGSEESLFHKIVQSGAEYSARPGPVASVVVAQSRNYKGIAIVGFTIYIGILLAGAVVFLL